MCGFHIAANLNLFKQENVLYPYIFLSKYSCTYLLNMAALSLEFRKVLFSAERLLSRT